MLGQCRDMNSYRMEIMASGIVITEMRKDDGYVNATRMCQAVGKAWKSYYRNDQTQAFLEATARSLQMPIDRIVCTTMSGPNAERGTWVQSSGSKIIITFLVRLVTASTNMQYTM